MNIYTLIVIIGTNQNLMISRIMNQSTSVTIRNKDQNITITTSLCYMSRISQSPIDNYKIRHFLKSSVSSLASPLRPCEKNIPNPIEKECDNDVEDGELLPSPSPSTSRSPSQSPLLQQIKLIEKIIDTTFENGNCN